MTNYKQTAVKLYVFQFLLLFSLQQDTESNLDLNDISSFLSLVCRLKTKSFQFSFSFLPSLLFDSNIMEIALPLLLLFLPSFAICLDYTFSLNYPFLLRNDYMGITSVTRDIGNEVLMFLQNNQVRRYSADLTSYVVFNTPDLVQKCSSDTFALSNVQLSNGTTFSIQGKVTTTISRTYTTVKTYSYPNFTLLSDYQGSQTILDYKTIALQSPSTDTPINIIIGSLTAKVYYRNQILTVFDYSQIFAVGVACTAAKFSKLSTNYAIDYISSSLNLYVALNSNVVIELTIILSLQFNFASQAYGLFPSTSYTQIISLPSPAQSMFFKNGILFMQQGNGQISAYDSVGASSVLVDGTVPLDTLQDVIFKDNRWYLLYYNQLVQVINQISVGFSLLKSVASFAGKQYNLVLGLNFDLIYVAGESYIYKMGYCLGQSYFDGSACLDYNCFDTMCTNCWMHSNPCGVCNSGYPRTDNYVCSGSPPNTTANSTPSNSINYTIPTSSNHTTNSTQSLISTFLSGRGRDFISFLSNLLKFSISLPSGRRIVYPLFYFFGNFDDIYLYSFHDGFYGRVAEGLFRDIQDIQNAKWSVVERWDSLSFIFGEQSEMRNKLSSRAKYLSYPYHLENKMRDSEGLFFNSYDFFLFSLPVSIIVYMLMRAAYKCFIKYSISRVFRVFSLWGFLFLLNFDGNTQQFTFYICAELKNLSFFTVFHKTLAVCALLFGFIIFILSFGGYLIGLLVYRKLNRSLTDNNKNSLRGNMQLLFQNCMRNFLLGAIHSLMRYTVSKNTTISILLVVEIVFQVVFVVQSTCKVFRKVNKFWFYAMLSFTRIILIITFYFEHRSSYGSLLQQVQVALILANIAIYLLSVAILVCQSGHEILKFVLLLTRVNKPVSLSTPFQGTIKSRILTLRRIARQNQLRGEIDIFETKGEQERAVDLEQLA